jgi:glycosyltransferase involved in cell wall biosynthesis
MSRRDASRGSRPLRVGLVAPPWLSVPPKGYGGTESVIDALARGLQAAGHEVLLFATGDSTCPVPRRWHFEGPSSPMGNTFAELTQVRSAYRTLAGCDVIHDHTLAGAVWAAGFGPAVPVVVTNHGEFNDDLRGLFRDLARSADIVAISEVQRRTAQGVPVCAVIHHGVEASRFTVGAGGGGYLAFVGRMHPDKGIHRAIEIARRAGMPLRIAAKMREPLEQEYFRDRVQPLLGTEVDYLGELSHDERDLLVGGADALLNPISWPEPFGMVMIEAFAVGTPVVAFPNGAAPEIITDGVTGYLVAGIDEAVAAVGHLDALDRGACRAAAEGPFSAARMVADHVRVYELAVARHVAGGTIIPMPRPVPRSLARGGDA